MIRVDEKQAKQVLDHWKGSTFEGFQLRKTPNIL